MNENDLLKEEMNILGSVANPSEVGHQMDRGC